jgi:hypothetical protein
VLTEIRPTPYGHDCERLAVGKIQPLDPKNIACVEDATDIGRSRFEGELENLSLRADSAVDQLPFDRPETCGALTKRSNCDEPTEPLSGVDETLITQHFECSANGDAARSVRTSEIGL